MVGNIRLRTLPIARGVLPTLFGVCQLSSKAVLQLRPQLSDVQLLVRELLRRCEQSESGAIQTLLRLRLRVAHGAL